MEQKMKQKRATSGLIQASDVRTASAKNRANSGLRRELHGILLYFTFEFQKI